MGKFSFSKKGYDQAEVDTHLNALNFSCERTTQKLQDRILALQKQNDELTKKVEIYEKEKDKIFSALTIANEKASDLKQRAEQMYVEEMERLTAFQERWTSFAKKIVETLTPDQAIKFEELNKKLDDVIRSSMSFSFIAKSKDKSKKFNPIKRIQEVFFGMTDMQSEFCQESEAVVPLQNNKKEQRLNPVAEKREFVIDLDEVLQTDQSLEELCKDLGLM